jgi:hypothetical protein
MQKTLFRQPAASLDQFLVQHRNLPCGATEADEAEFEPEPKGFGEANL